MASPRLLRSRPSHSATPVGGMCGSSGCADSTSLSTTGRVAQAGAAGGPEAAREQVQLMAKREGGRVEIICQHQEALVMWNPMPMDLTAGVQLNVLPWARRSHKRLQGRWSRSAGLATEEAWCTIRNQRASISRSMPGHHTWLRHLCLSFTMPK
ncbi:hypothetical protein SKAU_G00285130 [Synaphobranchus kaupii]|uniref:Uncharacterized protein n=1 Tax=Synaphobranchus kaupii TaxID=118154 RepID=A0A9Q1EXX9_SYNKA|nr:hypothetical protein SKAU_G00285130 [Synaphobranchus kaupii]